MTVWPFDLLRRSASAWLLLAASTLLASVPAQAAGETPAPSLTGRTLDGRAFDLAQLRGRVVMLVLWSTDCAVCLDKLPELRENARGWAGKAFDLVTVGMDTQLSAAQNYENLRRVTRPAEANAWTLWQGALSLPVDWRQARPLPQTFLIDREGRIVARYAGRIPADAWNTVADLLP